MDNHFNASEYIWYWLEDEPSTTNYFASNVIPSLNIKTETYKSVESLLDVLTEKKKNNLLHAQKYGFILDIMILGTDYVYLPPGWTDSKLSMSYSTGKGYDTGLVFYETAIMNLNKDLPIYEADTPFYNPPPPVIILSVMKQDDKDYPKRLNQIKTKWAVFNETDPIHARVAFINKWEASTKLLKETFEKWNLK